MKTLTTKASIYLILSVTGVISAIYSIKIKNYALLVVSILFAAVSADNIFCNLNRQKSIKTMHTIK